VLFCGGKRHLTRLVLSAVLDKLALMRQRDRLLKLFLFIPFLSQLLYPGVISAQWANVGNVNNPNPAQFCDLEYVFKQALQLIAGLVGVAILLTIIIAGFKLITAGGDAKAAGSAQQTLTFAMIGAALFVLAIFIPRFIRVFTGVDVLSFSIRQNPPCPP
jgi:hypothetical protein